MKIQRRPCAARFAGNSPGRTGRTSPIAATALALPLVLPSFGWAVDIPVSTPGEITNALASASPGDRLLVSPGTHGVLDLSGLRFSGDVTITSASQTDRAEFASIRLFGSAGIALDALAVKYGATNSGLTEYAIEIRDAERITVRGSLVESAPDGDPSNDAYGIYVRDSASVDISGNTISDVFRGVTLLEVTDASVRDTRFRRIGSDGIAGGGVVGAQIENNHFSGFRVLDPERFHPDAIQFWDTNAARPNEDITIAGNVILRGDGDATQGIFVRSQTLTANRIEIRDNVVQQSMGQGIYLENAAESMIANNTIAPVDWLEDKPGLDVRNLDAQSLVSANIASVLRMDGTIAGENNVEINFDNPWVGAYADEYILAPYERWTAKALDFRPLKDGIGAAQFATGFDDDGSVAIRHTRANPASLLDFSFEVFDGKNHRRATWTAAPADGGDAAEVLGGDAYFALGAAVSQVTVNLPGKGGSRAGAKKINALDPVVTDIAFAGGPIDASATPIGFTGGPASYGDEDGVGFARFNGLAPSEGGQFLTGAKAAKASSALGLSISARLRRAAPATAWQVLAAVPNSYQIRMNGDRLQAIFNRPDGTADRIDVNGAGLNDGQWHDMEVRYDGAGGNLSLRVDGAVVRSATIAPGPVAFQPSQPLLIGGAPWAASFQGDVIYFSIIR